MSKLSVVVNNDNDAGDNAADQIQVLTLKLISGEEVIGRVVKYDQACYEVQKPHIIVAGPNGAALIPYILSAPTDKAIKIYITAIAAVVATAQDIKTHYIKQTTGLII